MMFLTVSSVPTAMWFPGAPSTNFVHENVPHPPVSATRRGPLADVLGPPATTTTVPAITTTTAPTLPATGNQTVPALGWAIALTVIGISLLGLSLSRRRFSRN